MSYYSVSFVTCKDSRYAVVSSIYFAAHSLEQAKLRQRKTSPCDMHRVRKVFRIRGKVFFLLP